MGRDNGAYARFRDHVSVGPGDLENIFICDGSGDVLKQSGTLEWHKKLVIPLFCALLGPLAVGLAMPRRGRSVSALRSSGFAGLLIVAFFAGLMVGEAAIRQGRVGPIGGAWAATVVPALAALVALARRDERPHSFQNEYER